MVHSNLFLGFVQNRAVARQKINQRMLDGGCGDFLFLPLQQYIIVNCISCCAAKSGILSYGDRPLARAVHCTADRMGADEHEGHRQAPQSDRTVFGSLISE